MRLQLEKSYVGDDRFKLTQDFNVSFKDANKANAHIPEQVLGALSKREHFDFVSMEIPKEGKICVVDTGGYSSLEEGDVQWEHNVDLEKEKSNALSILSTVVPAHEVFLTSSKAGNKHAISHAKQNGQTDMVDKLVRKATIQVPRIVLCISSVLIL